ncbi:MAG: SDR family NAD(P)-dependent oxidoreductase [Kofleriaceae bacterium]|nr:SDR family NAD(P)-dependent oxidoreductase [Kofleriaceae bacterium]
MSKTIIVAGYGPGISKAVAERFGRDGYNVALVARSAQRITAGVKELASAGIKAEAFTADMSKPDDIKAVVENARALGPIAALHWNAYSGGAGDLTVATPEEMQAVLSVPVIGLVVAVQAALPDLRAQKGAVLVTNGGFGLLDPAIEAAAVQWNHMGLSVANAAKRKVVALLAAKLKPDGVYVGEVVVTGSIKGSAWDNGQANLEGAAVADRFWKLAQTRTEISVTI